MIVHAHKVVILDEGSVVSGEIYDWICCGVVLLGLSLSEVGRLFFFE